MRKSNFTDTDKNILAVPSNGLPVTRPGTDMLAPSFSRLALYVKLTSRCVSAVVILFGSLFCVLISSNK